MEHPNAIKKMKVD